MKWSLFPTCCSAPSNSAERGHPETQSLTDLRALAIRTLEANPAFRGTLANCAIDIKSIGDKLIIQGRVPSWHLKQLLQETLRRIDGVGTVENRVGVEDSGRFLSVE